MTVEKVDYAHLNGRQKENYNFHKIAARLADYGYTSMRLSDDFQGADFIALHIDGETFLRVQLKARLTFVKHYDGKGLHIAFREGDAVYLYPHDGLRQRLFAEGFAERSRSEAWTVDGTRSWPSIPKKMRVILEEYSI